MILLAAVSSPAPAQTPAVPFAQEAEPLVPTEPELRATAAAHGVTPLFALSRDGGVSLGLGGRF